MELPPEERFDIVSPILKEMIGRIAKGVDKKFGAKGQNLLEQAMGEIGVETGHMMKPLSPGEDFKSVGTFFAQAANIFGVENEVEIKEDEIVVKIPKCPYGLEDTNRRLCEAMMAFDMRVVETLGPDVALEIVKTLAVGDRQCELSIKPKK